MPIVIHEMRFSGKRTTGGLDLATAYGVGARECAKLELVIGTLQKDDRKGRSEMSRELVLPFRAVDDNSYSSGRQKVEGSS